MNKKIIISISSALILAGIIGFVGYKKGWFSKKTSVNATKKTTLSQQEADKIAKEVDSFVIATINKDGSLTKFTQNIRDNMLKPLWDAGYKYENGKAIRNI
jgi:hypothetical protein